MELPYKSFRFEHRIHFIYFPSNQVYSGQECNTAEPKSALNQQEIGSRRGRLRVPQKLTNQTISKFYCFYGQQKARAVLYQDRPSCQVCILPQI